MTRVRRLMIVCAVLCVTGGITSSHVWGGAGNKLPQRVLPSGSRSAPDTRDRLEDDLAQSKFANGGLVTYRTSEGELLFALPVKPKLDPVPARPRDYLIMVDTSASQVAAPLHLAQALTEELIAKANADDRIDLWTVNIPNATRDLSHGFQSPMQAQAAIEELKKEVPLGDTDLKNGLAQALKSFGGEEDRQRVILFFGDGMSVHDPISLAERTKLCQQMVENKIAFFPVPMGPRIDPYNLHGLASGTGGLLVHVLARDKAADILNRLSEAVAAPILYPTGIQMPAAEVTEFFPTRLPPLRPDAPTLVVGKIQPGQNLEYTVSGTVAGKTVTVTMTEPVTDPELDNFFLVGIFDQWKKAKDLPALMRADRALAFAQELNLQARQDLLDQAHLALSQNNLDAAKKLFEQTRTLDPHESEAEGGLKLVEQMREGKMTREQLGQRLAQAPGAGLPAPVPSAAPPALAPSVDPNDPLKQQQMRMAIADQRATQSVDDAMRQARRELTTSPDAAHDLLHRVLAGIRDDPDLSDRTRQVLGNRLEGALRTVDAQGGVIKRDQEERVQRLAEARARFQEDATRLANDERTQERMRTFHNLMNQARFENAYALADAIRVDAISQGTPVPPSVTAAYDISLATYHLSTLQEFRRTREERYLATMLEVERSFVPSPDEPPVHFPKRPFSVVDWHELSTRRKEAYTSSGLTENDPVLLHKVKLINKLLDKPVKLDKGIDAGTKLPDALDVIQGKFLTYTDEEGHDQEISFQPNRNAFTAEQVQYDQLEVKLPRMVGVSLKTVLRLLLEPLGLTYIVRPEYIEITTQTEQAREKTLRVFPVADLVTPIAQSVNQASLNQNSQLLGQTLTIGGGAGVGGLNQGAGVLGFGGGLLGGGLGALGALGGLNALGGQVLGGAGLGALGAAGGGLQGAAGGFGGAQLGFQGGQPQNQGFGGGLSGFGGGQQGQFGNLGGQFGIQGGNTSNQLIAMIQSIVAPGEWAQPNVFNNPQAAANPVGDPTAPDAASPDFKTLNQIAYYDPALALIVRGSSRIHTSLGGSILKPPANPAPGMGALDKPREGALAKGPDLKGPPDKDVKPGTVKPDKAPTAVATLDPRKMWQDALAKAPSDPGLVIATADFLAENGKFDHVAEFLKADLRLGIVAKPWVYDALAIALKESKGSTDEIERAQLSSLDLEPQSSGSYLQASRAMGDHKKYDRALAFCHQASLLEPNAARPYEEALLYAEKGEDSQAMEWAAGNLISRDWPTDNDQMHGLAQERLKSLVRMLQKNNHHDEADRMSSLAQQGRERDLVIQLTWQGEADLDLEVKEPIGTICSFMHRQAPGGGTLIGDTLSDSSRESYVAGQAFTGLYEVTVRRIWGRPLGNKATLKIIQHQGTTQERMQLETVVLGDNSSNQGFTLQDGRRTSVARVAPEAVNRPPQPEVAAVESSTQVFNKLRQLANPDLARGDAGFRGGFTSAGRAVASMPEGPPPQNLGSMVAYQEKVSPFLTDSVDFTLQEKMSADRRYISVSLTPVFQTLDKGVARPVITNPVIPGGV